jgi:hypothetical protein
VGEGGLEFGDDPLAGRGVRLGLHRVATHDVPAVVDDDLLDFEIVGDRPVAAGPRQDLLAELLLFAQLAPQDVVEGRGGMLRQQGQGPRR